MNSNELSHHGIKGMKWGVRRYQNKNGSLMSAGKKRASDPVHEDYKKAHDKKSVKSMSDAELRSRNNRLQMERQYAKLTKKTWRGKQAVKTIISAAGTIAAAESAYKTYKRFGDKALSNIGNWVVKDLSKGLKK